MKKIQITIDWAFKLIEQLNILKNINLPNIENIYIGVARELYFITLSKIKEIELKLINADIIDISKIKKKDIYVIFASTVILKNINTQKIYNYKIVGEEEAQLKDNTISITSPLAYMLIDKKVGDIIMFNTFLGFMQYKIIDIKYI